MGILDEMLEGKKSIVILGHVNPDGDCIGSCLGLYNYLKENYEGLEVSVYLEKMGVKFSFLSGFEDVHTEYDDTKTFDLCIISGRTAQAGGGGPPRGPGLTRPKTAVLPQNTRVLSAS